MTTPQIEQFAKMIRERKVAYDSADDAANEIRRELELLGVKLDPDRLADLDAAARMVREAEQDVEILRKVSIIDDREEWYQGPGANDHHWPALQSYLANTKGWASATLMSLDQASNEVVSLLDNPKRDRFACRGLVVGYVQSGKTANMTAVMARAVDAGYNLIIVLGGVTNKLRKQTQDRFQKDVIARYRHLWQLYTTSEEDGDFSHPANGSFTLPHEGHAQLIVMKKEGSRLRALKKTIDKTPPVVLEKLKVLLIDDECDQASVNSARGEFDMTRINEEIRKVIAALPAVSYVGYTATPFANVFIDPYPFNQDELDDLYPKHFITSLERPQGYFGTADVFGRDSDDEESEGRDMVRLLAPEDAVLLQTSQSKDKASFRPSMTPSLEDAVMWFLASCAIRRARGQSGQHMTMLVHSSQFISQHEYMSDLIRDWVATNGPAILDRATPMAHRFDELFEFECSRTAPAGTDRIPETIGTVRALLPDVLADLRFPVENGVSDRRLDYDNGPLTCIVVGGTVLARGLTLEGLTVSFFLRTSKQYDTLLQMGRWFGYRPGYDDLPRLWTTADLAATFRALAMIEEEIREDIATYRERNLTPTQFAVRVRSIPGMAITSASKMKHAHRTSMSFDGQHIQTIRFDHLNADIVRGNWLAASNLVDTMLEGKPRPVPGGPILFRDVSPAAIRRFLVETSISDEHMDLKQLHLLGYLDEATHFASWNVGIIQPRSETTSARPLGALGHVATMRRARLRTAPPHYADIKALMSKRDILIDVDEDMMRDRTTPDAWRDLKALRPNVPLLLLYPIDASSPPRSGSPTRTALNAVGDLIGFGMVFPGERDRSGGYFSVELDAPAIEQAEETDELAELQEEAIDA